MTTSASASLPDSEPPEPPDPPPRPLALAPPSLTYPLPLNLESLSPPLLDLLAEPFSLVALQENSRHHHGFAQPSRHRSRLLLSKPVAAPLLILVPLVKLQSHPPTQLRPPADPPPLLAPVLLLPELRSRPAPPDPPYPPYPPVFLLLPLSFVEPSSTSHPSSPLLSPSRYRPDSGLSSTQQMAPWTRAFHQMSVRQHPPVAPTWSPPPPLVELPDPPYRISPSWSVSVSLELCFETYGSFSRLVMNYHLVMGCLPLPPSLGMNFRFPYWLIGSYVTVWALYTHCFTPDLCDTILGFKLHDQQMQHILLPQLEVLWLFLSLYLPLIEYHYCDWQARLKFASVQNISRLIFTPLWFHVELIYDISVYPGFWIYLDHGSPFFSVMESVCLLIPPILCGIDVGSILLTSSETPVSTLLTGSAIWCLNASFAAAVLAIVNCALDAVSIADFRTLHVITNFHGCNVSSTAMDVKFRGRLCIFSCWRDLFVSIYLLLSLYLAFAWLLCYFVNS